LLPEYKLDRLITSYYEDVGKYQIFLTPEEEEALFHQYDKLRLQLRDTMLSIPEAVYNLEKLYWDTVLDGRSPVKLTNKFNTNIPGQNKRIAVQMEKAAKSGEWSDVPLTIRVCIKLCNKVADPNIDGILSEIARIEDQIVRSTLQAGISVAYRYASNIFGIEMKDAIQEASEGILGAMENYDVNYLNVKGNKIKFITYAYNNAVKRVKEYIMNQSRLVRLPRHKLDIIFILIESSKEAESLEDLPLLAKKCNNILQNRKNRELKNTEIITEETLNEAIKLLQGSPVHIDQSNIYTSEEPTRPKTIGDLIVDDSPNAEDIASAMTSRILIQKKLLLILPRTEFLVIHYKYLQNQGDRSLEEVKDILKKRHGINISRQRVNQIKASAFSRLRKMPEFRNILKESIS
jgi:RNA polymerase sigma factor (sigma-70 family)